MRLLGYELRKVKKGEYTLLHPDYKTVTQFVFDIDGTEYFEFKSLLDMPTLRYKKVIELIREAEMSVKSVDISKYLKDSIQYLNDGDLAKSIIIQNALIHLSSQFMETETYYRLFSCVFFTIDEDLSDYDEDYNEIKIDLFKKQKIGDFFFKEPMRKYLTQPNISPKDLELFLKLTKVNKDHLHKLGSKTTTI
jgi:hypothetical protein